MSKSPRQHLEPDGLCTSLRLTPDELGEEVIRERLDFTRLLAAGHAHSAERGFKPSEVMSKIAEYRRGKINPT